MSCLVQNLLARKINDQASETTDSAPITLRPCCFTNSLLIKLFICIKDNGALQEAFIDNDQKLVAAN